MQVEDGGQAAFQRVKSVYYRNAFGLRLLVFILLWFVGAAIFAGAEKWKYSTGLYFTTETLATVGFGGVVPCSPGSKFFLVVYAIAGLISFGLVLVASTTWWLHVQRYRLKYGTPGMVGRLLPRSIPQVYLPIAVISVVLFMLIMLASLAFSFERETLPPNSCPGFHPGSPSPPSLVVKDKKWGFLNAFYFVCTTLATIGYGDLEATSSGGMTAIVFLIVAFDACRILLLASISHLTYHYTKRTAEKLDAKNLSDTKPDKVILLGLWLGLLVFTLVLAFSLSSIESWSVGNAFYFMIVTVTTIGYGDITVVTSTGKIFVALYSIFLFAIKFVILYFTQRLRYKQKFSEKTGPVWVDDSSVGECMACTQAFGMVRRRHHCRNCGGVYCATCSRWRAPIVDFGHTDPVRVCEKCFKNLGIDFNRVVLENDEETSPKTRREKLATQIRHTVNQWKAYWKLVAALLLLIFILLLGGIIFSLIEKWSYLEGLYFTCVTVLTIGYGDKSASKPAAKVVLTFYALIGYALFYWVVVELQATSTRVATKSIEKKRQDLIPLLDKEPQTPTSTEPSSPSNPFADFSDSKGAAHV